MEIKRASHTDKDFMDICAMLNDTHNEHVAEQRWPGSDSRENVDQFEQICIMYDGETPAASIAAKPAGEGRAEVGRVFVSPEYRRRGLATKMLAFIEERLREGGVRVMCLDTYERMPGAIALYEKYGFKKVEPFPGFEVWPYSVCMEKEIG